MQVGRGLESLHIIIRIHTHDVQNEKSELYMFDSNCNVSNAYPEQIYFAALRSRFISAETYVHSHVYYLICVL